MRYLEATGWNRLSVSRDTTITWNVRTMFQSGKAAQIAAEMQRYTALLRISRSRWIQSGQKRLINKEMFLFSGHKEEDAPHTEGVALMLSRSAQKALIGWESHRPRIIKAAFRTKQKKIKLNII